VKEEPVIHKKTSVGRWVAGCVVCLFILMLLFPFIAHGFAIYVETPFHFALGWLFHAFRTLPVLREKMGALSLPLGCLILAGTLLHRFLSRTLRAKEPPLVWRPKDTMAFLILIVSGCAAAISLSGIIHQMAWLRADPWYERSSSSDRIAAVSDTRALLLEIAEFQFDKGRYPHSLEELKRESDIFGKKTWFRGSRNLLPEPFILLHPGSPTVVPDSDPLLVSPVFHNGRKMVVGYGNMSVRTVDAGELKTILRNLDPKQTQPQKAP
jgi:hypothetical protein